MIENARHVKSREACAAELEAKHGPEAAKAYEKLLDQGRRLEAIRYLRDHGVEPAEG